MAVLDAYPGLRTEITINKKPLAEYYHEEEASQTTVTKYIEACSGAEFIIKTTFSQPFPLVNGVETSAVVDVDRGPGYAVKPDDRFYRSANMKGVSFTQDGKRYQQKYQFAELNIVEEDEGVEDSKSLRKDVESKGCIEVSYRWVTNFRPLERSGKRRNTDRIPMQEIEASSAPMPRRQLPTIGAIPEKMLKGDARSHQAILGEPIAKKAPTGPGETYDYVDRDPFGIIHFQYRSSAALKALHVFTNEDPKPEAEPSPAAEPSTTTTRHSRQESGLSNVKEEAGGQSRVKREHNAGGDVQDDAGDLCVVETRRCKRPRAEQEVIVLD